MSRTQAHTLMIVCLLVAAGLRWLMLPDAPPGLHYDEAANAILSGDIGLRGDRPIFISSYTGKEVFFFYIAGGMMRLLGESVFTLRLAAGFLGVLTVAATYHVTIVLFRKRHVAVWAAVLLAVSFWHLLFSRLGFRAVSQPLLQALTIAFLWRGIRAVDDDESDRAAWLCGWAGLFLGLTAYTYLAARLFPVLLLLAGLPLIPKLNRYWRPLSWTLATGLATLTPLLTYFRANPDAFWVRIGQVGSASDLSYLDGILMAWGMLFGAGDPYWRFNIPGRSLFPAVLIAFFAIGLWRLGPDWYGRTRHTGFPRHIAAILLILFTPAVMLLPTGLAIGEILPSNLRAIGMLPFIYILPAAGISFLIEQANWFLQPAESDGESSAVSTSIWLALPLLLVVVALLAGGRETYQLYFNAWGTRADLFFENDSDIAAVAEYLNASELAEGENIYVSAEFDRHPTLAFLAEEYDRVRWLPLGQAIVIPTGRPFRVLFTDSAPAPAVLEPILAQAAEQVSGPVGPNGRPTFVGYRFEADSVTFDRPEHVVNANFGFAATLMGYNVGTGTSGVTIPLTVYWRIDGQPSANLQPFVHLEDVRRYRWGQLETYPFPSRDWQIGDVLIQQIDVPVAAGAPPDFYRIKIGLFDAHTQQQIARFDEAGRYAGVSLPIESIPVLAGTAPQSLPAAPLAINAEVWPGLTLLGYEKGQRTLTHGEGLWVSAWWSQAADTQIPNFIVRYELLRSDNSGIILGNRKPAQSGFPFSEWQAPQFVIDHQLFEIPLRLAAGEYELQMRLLDETGQTLYKTRMDSVTIVESDRQFEIPDATFTADAVLGGEIGLLGYDAVDAQDVVNLTLYWQAVERPVADYTVFVHLLNADGTCCVWQRDTQPQAGAKPTSLWLPGEVVADGYTVSVPAELASGSYTLEVGMYISESGQRLQVAADLIEVGGDVIYLRPIQVD